jgi:hypothetical protein
LAKIGKKAEGSISTLTAKFIFPNMITNAGQERNRTSIPAAVASGEVMADEEIKRLMRSLGQSIHKTLGDAPKIDESIQNIRDAGYEVYLVIESKTGFDRKNQAGDENLSLPVKTDEAPRLRITRDDAKFLKSLKISVDESE